MSHNMNVTRFIDANRHFEIMKLASSLFRDVATTRQLPTRHAGVASLSTKERNLPPSAMGWFCMDIEARLRKLESRYRAASISADTAKAHYLALSTEPSATRADVEAANARWQQLDSRKRTVAVRMGELEALEDAIP
jgi:hypothetical protein